MDCENRIVVLIDMDCFYCQVEEKLNPELKGKPVAVVQYNPWKGGGIIAVNYVARAQGVSRHTRGDEAKEKCPEIQLPSVPCVRGKADITKYRDAGKEVAKVLQRFTPLLERASIDEAYLDITIPVQEKLKTLNVNSVTMDMLANTFALGYDSIEEFVADVQTCGSDSIDFDYEHAKHLLVGTVIVSEIRAAVFNETGYECSAGIAHNKIMAKLVCGMNKPNKQTVLPKHCVNILFETLPIKKVKHLGGKFGDSVCEALKINKMGELQKFTEKQLQAKFDEKNGTWLYNIARGIDVEPVQSRFNPKSIGCCKQFRGKTALTDLETLKKWLKDLGDEIEERLDHDALESKRTPRQMVVSFSQQVNGSDVSSSRSHNFVSEDELCGELFSKKALELLLESVEGVKPKDGELNRKLKAPIKFLGISVGKFEDHTDDKKTKKIKDYFTIPSCSKEVLKENVNTVSAKNNTDKTIIKKNEGKVDIFRKFFQNNNISDTFTLYNKSMEENKKEDIETKPNEKALESSLDKQESFFAKFLKTELTKNTSDNIKIEQPFPPSSDIVNTTEASNDTDYSGSTIDKEINRSISLFEDDPTDIDRVSSMRNLLNTSKLIEEAFDEADLQEPHIECNTIVKRNPQAQVPPTLKCPECGKIIDVNMFDTHADYHLALKLREEERKLMRKEVMDRSKEKENYRNQDSHNKMKPGQDEAASKNEGMSSIANYFKKIDETIPTETCSECGKRIPLEMFAVHLDFHEAQRLNRELNNKTVQNNMSGSSVKRKRKSGSPVKKPKVPCKSIDLFFR